MTNTQQLFKKQYKDFIFVYTNNGLFEIYYAGDNVPIQRYKANIKTNKDFEIEIIYAIEKTNN